MKPKRTYLFIVISSVALVIVLIIQVNWIFQTAKIKETLFNEKANMVLSRTTEALRADTETCRKIDDSVDDNNTGGSVAKLGTNEINTIDSLFRHYLKFYNFHIDYSFEVVKPNPATAIYQKSMSNYMYNKPLEAEVINNDIELKLIFPEKNQFIVAEMGTLFITSVILILVVLVMFWKTIRSLLLEQKISEHTTDFLNNMTHEFKTPLTNIALAGKLMMKEPAMQQEDKIKHYTGIILEENEKLRLQVEQVLSLTALERGEIPLRKSELDFHDLIKDSIKNFDLQIENKIGRINLHMDADRYIIVGDKTHLANMIYNLIDNAIKYSPGRPEITIRTVNRNQKLVIIFSDNGIGIEKEYQKIVFDKYFRVPTGDVHDVKGFGLGLAYIKKIIELHDGTIELESENGKGTTFTITMQHSGRKN